MIFSLSDKFELYVLNKKAKLQVVGEHGFGLLARYTNMKKMWEDMYRKNIEGFTYTGFLHYALLQNTDFKQLAIDAFKDDFDEYEL